MRVINRLLNRLIDVFYLESNDDDYNALHLTQDVTIARRLIEEFHVSPIQQSTNVNDTYCVKIHSWIVIYFSLFLIRVGIHWDLHVVIIVFI